MLRLLYLHTRNINAMIYAKKVIYHIPVYHDNVIPKILSIKQEYGSLIIEIERENKITDKNIEHAPICETELNKDPCYD